MVPLSSLRRFHNAPEADITHPACTRCDSLVHVRVVVADDSVLLREGLVRLLTEVDCEVVAAVEDAPSFLQAVAEHRPDVAIVDVRMPPSMTDDGLRAAVEARASQPDLGILMLSAYVELSYADVLLSDGRGRVGYLLKDRVTSLETLVDALRARVATSDSGDETAGLADQIEGIVGNIIAAGGDVDREDQMAGEEWNRDVRYALARGTDPVYAGR